MSPLAPASLPLCPEYWQHPWTSPLLRAGRARLKTRVVLAALVTLTSTSFIALALVAMWGLGGSLAFAINVFVAIRLARIDSALPRCIGVGFYALAFCPLGTFTLFYREQLAFPLEGHAWSIAWCAAWSFVSGIILHAVTRSLLVDAGVVIATLGCASALAWLPGGLVIGCAAWNLIIGIALFTWSLHHRAWSELHTCAFKQTCPGCAYSLAGISTPICPECGIDLRAMPARTP